MLCGQHRRLFALMLAAAIAAGVSAGCGQKGPLYLPDDEEQEEEQQQGTRQPAPASG